MDQELENAEEETISLVPVTFPPAPLRKSTLTDENREVPILPLRNAVIYPGMMTPLSVGRRSSQRMLEDSLPQSDLIAVTLQREAEEDDVGPDDLFPVACLARVLRMIRRDEDNAVIIIQGLERVTLTEFTQREPFLKARVDPLPDILPAEDDEYWTASVKNLQEGAIRLVQQNPTAGAEAVAVLASIEDPSSLTDFLAAHLSLEVEKQQHLLEELNVSVRVATLQKQVDNQLRISEIQEKLRSEVESEFTESQRRAYLREQLRAIQKELGEEGSVEEEVEDLRQRLDEAKLPQEAREQADRELRRLEIIPPQSPDHSVILNYLETMAELPWGVFSEDNLDLNAAQKTLDQDHHGLTKVKRRILEFLAV
ncbi:MAG: LON peptidase substrate-binding domain-containing protein, partial [Verrucomicrobiota bacterium]